MRSEEEQGEDKHATGQGKDPSKGKKVDMSSERNGPLTCRRCVARLRVPGGVQTYIARPSQRLLAA
jgi:hypothetical protein